MRRTLTVALLGSSLAAAPESAAAQFGFEALLGGINDISVYAICWNARGAIRGSSTCGNLEGGFGVRVTYSTGNLGQPPRAEPAPAHPCVPPTPSCVPASVATPSSFWYITLSLGYGQFAALRECQ
ncbi:MAG: hypothetical protein ACT4OZ_08905 [Gemmatimonadota bacterium]